MLWKQVLHYSWVYSPFLLIYKFVAVHISMVFMVVTYISISEQIIFLLLHVKHQSKVVSMDHFDWYFPVGEFCNFDDFRHNLTSQGLTTTFHVCTNIIIIEHTYTYWENKYVVKWISEHLYNWHAPSLYLSIPHSYQLGRISKSFGFVIHK